MDSTQTAGTGEAAGGTARLARRLWGRLEAVHTLAYFAPQVHRAHAELGLADRMVGYVAARSAPFGPIGPEVVTAAFHGFQPAVIAHALPGAWQVATPQEVLRATDAALLQVLAPLIGDAPELDRAAELAREAALLHPTLGRPLAAAWSSVPWAEAPALVLWQAATRIRESRGDGHVALLVEAELDGVEAHLTTRGDNPKLRKVLGTTRGISEPVWDAAADRLRARGLLDGDGALTPEGQALRARIEARTDELAAPAWDALGLDAGEALLAALDPLVARILDAGVLPGVVARGAVDRD